ncbi:precorrin-2 dehydrogenase/sirohydrochlorin ferrochelatase family protein [Sphingomonas morindae]|uniref:precorrin-2 dehydrogenase n=1 Tax=Sphingomonas morindae TaxID=1541170 RepID=A0ABY4XBQ3_9SPHN|nr:NAD(P)-dependent oxidoreductase [Sphingomonas morindae]USI74347.1 siroheme synthase [Sphingomonas morindae]
MHSLPLFVRLAGRPVIVLGQGEAAEAKRRLLRRAGAEPAEEGAPAALAIVAIEEPAAAEAAVARLRARGILVNAVDRPALCDFTLPAIVDRDPLLIAIGTGGASAGLAKALRQRLEAWLPAGLGGLARALHAARPVLRARLPDAADRRRAIDAALAPGGPLDPLADPPVDAVHAWAAGAEAVPAARIETVTVDSPDPDALTLRAARLLGQADWICHAADMPPALLDRARADAARHAAPEPPADASGLVVRLVWAD